MISPFQSQTSKGVQGFPPLTFAGSGVLTPGRRAVLGASAWACTALQGGPGFNGGYLVNAAAAVHLGGRPGFRAGPGMPGARWPDRSARGGRAVTPLVYVTIFARSPGGGWFQDTKKPGLADTKTGQKLTGKGTPGHENNHSRLRTDNL